jgi:hypothetical protein
VVTKKLLAAAGKDWDWSTAGYTNTEEKEFTLLTKRDKYGKVTAAPDETGYAVKVGPQHKPDLTKWAKQYKDRMGSAASSTQASLVKWNDDMTGLLTARVR